MKIKHALLSGFALVAVGLAGGLLLADDFGVDPVHSSVYFRIQHQDLAPVYGRFNTIAGSITLNADNLAGSSFAFNVQAGSVDTNNQKRDDHLRSPDFFNAKQFPEITFKSTKVAAGKDGAFEVTGDMTLKGVTKNIAVTVQQTGAGKDKQGAKKVGFTCEFDLKRSDYGMDFMQGPGQLGDEVHLFTAFECKAK